MQWDRSSVIGLARLSCSSCHGYGLRLVRQRKEVPCHCVFRAIFRACYNRFRDCAVNAGYTSTVSMEFCPGREGRRTYSRKREEYMADFCLVSRRVLDDFEHRIFRYHFLLGADWKACCRRLGIDRGIFFHAVYRIERKLGQTFAELEPFALYPVDEYFGSLLHREPPSSQPPGRAHGLTPPRLALLA